MSEKYKNINLHNQYELRKNSGYVMITHIKIKNYAQNHLEYNQMVEPLPQQCFHQGGNV